MTLPSSGPLTFSDIQTEFGGSNPIGLNEYYAGGGLVPSGTTGTYGAVPTSGQISVQNFYGTSNYIPVYIEELFSTYLYNGNSSTQTITNGIDLAGKGGIVLFKSRNNATNWNLYSTTSASPWYYLSTLSTEAIQAGSPNRLQSFNSNGFTLGADYPNYSGYTFASWTFRKQPKFFDVVTYTGNGGTQQNIPHNLQAYPGLIIVKRTDSAGNWYVCPIMQSNWNNDYLLLNSAAGKVSSVNIWQSTSGTSLTTFGVLDGSTVNISGATYVAYLFAHDAGGFGLTGSDNVISCGSFTTDVNGRATITLNYEPQWLLVKRTSGGTGNWEIADNMRGWTVSGNASLYPNLANVENNPDNYKLTATGFSADNGAGSSNFIYIAIRRGPMKVPTSGTSVFVPITYTGSGTAGTVRTTGIVTDMVWSTSTLYGGGVVDYDRLRGAAKVLQTGSAGQEQNEAGTAIGLQGFDLQNGYYAGPDQGSGTINYSGYPYVNWVFRRAPKFFDEVCYTGDGGATKLINHNLGVAPELLIVKIRGGSDNWWVYNSFTGSDWRVRLNASSSEQNDNVPPEMWGTIFSSTQFQVGNNVAVNNNATSYVAYLFATCPGVSKVGTYTGTGPGTLITVNCGFTSGARFVLIRRLYGGDWYVYDSARGISSGSDPYLTLNGYSAQTTGTNYVDTTSVGFQVTAAAPYELNTNGLTFLFLAIA